MQAAHISRLSTFYRFLHWISSDGTRAARKIQRSQIDCWNKLEKIESHQSNRAAPTVDVFIQSAIEMQFVFPEAYHTTLPWQERLEGQLNFPTSSLFFIACWTKIIFQFNCRSGAQEERMRLWHRNVDFRKRSSDLCSNLSSKSCSRESEILTLIAGTNEYLP